VTQRVHFAGLVPDAQLPSYYRSAQALIYVSLYEGFGLPLLEAMACGTPVITSNISALPETSGGAAVLVDPTSVEQISGAINKVMNDTTLRRILRERGLTQAARYSWSNTTARVQEVLARSTV
jgi:glycosyltransferase involved in cell wall biosynthesis